jgi:hypothetical protein
MSFLLNLIFNQQHSQYVNSIVSAQIKVGRIIQDKKFVSLFLNNHLQIAINVYVEYRELRCITHP